MKVYAGIEIGPVVCVVVVSPENGQLARSVYTLPLEEPNRREAVRAAVRGALEHLPGSLPPCTAVGISISPLDDYSLSALVKDGSFPIDLPYLSGMPALYAGSEVGALFAHYSGGQGRTWLTLSDRGRVYLEADEAVGSDGEFEELGGKGAKKRIRYRDTSAALEPIRVLRNRFGLFESIDEMTELANLVDESAGVRIAERPDGPAVLGLKRGVRRPHIARGAFESVASWIRQSLSELAGEGVVTELYAAGPAVMNNILMGVLADITGATVVVSDVRDAIAFGAAMRAAAEEGGVIDRPKRKRFNPRMPASQREEIFTRWRVARE